MCNAPRSFGRLRSIHDATHDPAERRKQTTPVFLFYLAALTHSTHRSIHSLPTSRCCKTRSFACRTHLLRQKASAWRAPLGAAPQSLSPIRRRSRLECGVVRCAAFVCSDSRLGRLRARYHFPPVDPLPLYVITSPPSSAPQHRGSGAPRRRRRRRRRCGRQVKVADS